MGAVRLLSGLCTAVFGPRSKISRGPSPVFQNFLPLFYTPETNCSYRRLIVTVQSQNIDDDAF